VKTLAAAGDLAALRGRIILLTTADKARWGSMSVAQMVCHLRDSFACPLGERVLKPLKATSIPIPIYKRLALWLPVQWPQGVPTAPEVDQNIGGTPPVDFAVDRDGLLTELDRFAGSSGPWGLHPIFGAMTTREWMRWGYLHTDHHLRQFAR